jgi:hypothetical protein
MRKNFMRRAASTFRGKKQQSLEGETAFQMRAMTYDEVAAPWSRSNQLMGPRLLPSSDDSDNNFSRTPCRIRTEIMITQTSGLTKILCSIS